MGRSSHERQEALLKVASNVAATAIWSETPHLLIFDSAHTVDELNDLFKEAIDQEVDLLIIVKSQSSWARIIGPNNDQDIFKLINGIKASDDLGS